MRPLGDKIEEKFIDQTPKHYQFHAVITLCIDASINLHIFFNAEKEQ